MTPALPSESGLGSLMVSIVYAGQTLPMPDGADADRLADILLNSYAKGSYSWLWVDVAGTPPRRVQLMVGPGIPIAIIIDEKSMVEAAD